VREGIQFGTQFAPEETQPGKQFPLGELDIGDIDSSPHIFSKFTNLPSAKRI